MRQSPTRAHAPVAACLGVTGLGDSVHDEARTIIKALITRAGRLPVAFIGGIITLHPAIKLGIGTALPDATLTFPQIDAAAHAAQRARRINETTR